MTLAAAGAGIGALGSIFGGISAAQSASYQGQVARNNAIIEQQNAAYAGGAGAVQTEKAGLEGRTASAGIKAGQAANNLDTGSGSAADVQASQREINQFNTGTTANNAALSVYGYQTQAQGYNAQAGLDQAEVGSDIAGGFLKGLGGLASSASETGLGGASGGSILSGPPTVPDDYGWMQDKTLTDYES